MQAIDRIWIWCLFMLILASVRDVELLALAMFVSSGLFWMASFYTKDKGQ